MSDRLPDHPDFAPPFSWRAKGQPSLSATKAGRSRLVGLALLSGLLFLSSACASSRVPGLRHVLPPGFLRAVDDPVMVEVGDAEDFLTGHEPMIAVDGESSAGHAYSIWMLDRREVVNDEIAGTPILVSWCPLAGSTVVYDRRVDGQTLSFRVSGKLYHDALVLQDRETGTLWSQVDGRAIDGPLAGRRLEVRPSSRLTWDDWRQKHPGGRVLKKRWWDRRGRSDYAKYAADPSLFGLFDSDRDPRLPAKQLIWGAEVDGEALAIRLEALSETGPTEIGVGKSSLVVFREPGGKSVRAYRAEIAGLPLRFVSTADGALVDLQTGSRWDARGMRAVAGPLSGASLTPVAGASVYWFSWARFHPRTTIEPALDSATAMEARVSASAGIDDASVDEPTRPRSHLGFPQR